MAVSPVGAWNVVTNLNNAILYITGVDEYGSFYPDSRIEGMGQEPSFLSSGSLQDANTGHVMFEFQVGPELKLLFDGFTFQAGNPLFNFNIDDGVGPGATTNPWNMMAGFWIFQPDVFGTQWMGWAARSRAGMDLDGDNVQSLGTWNFVAALNNSVLELYPGPAPGAVTGNIVTSPDNLITLSRATYMQKQNQLYFAFPYLGVTISCDGFLCRTGDPLFEGPEGPVSSENAVWDLIAGVWGYYSTPEPPAEGVPSVGGWAARAPRGTWPDPESFSGV
jgi:hypothetical protein